MATGTVKELDGKRQREDVRDEARPELRRRWRGSRWRRWRVPVRAGAIWRCLDGRLRVLPGNTMRKLRPNRSRAASTASGGSPFEAQGCLGRRIAPWHV